MEDMKRELRDLLAVLADKLPLYSRAVRDAGFSCCHVNEDWIEENCTKKDDIALHRRYLIEYAREVLVSDSPSNILFEDGLNCRSSWLNELKAKRFAEFGPVDGMNSSKTRHLTALSPCLRELSRISEMPDRVARKHQETMVDAFVKRREHELSLHGEEIARCAAKLAVVERDEASLQAFYAARVAEVIAPLGARVIQTVQMFGSKKAVSFNFRGNLEFVLLPLISCSDPSRAQEPSGKVGMGFRFTTTDTLMAGKFEKDKYVVVHLYDLLPQEFLDYGRFNSPDELCLNILAWIAALRILLPDVMGVLRESKGENKGGPKSGSRGQSC